MRWCIKCGQALLGKYNTDKCDKCLKEEENNKEMIYDIPPVDISPQPENN